MALPDPADNTRHGIRVSTTIQRRAGVVDINTVQCGRKAVRVALTTHFAISDNVEACALLVPNCEERRIVLSLLQPLGRNSPRLLGTNSRRKAAGEFSAIDQPVWLWIAPDKSGRQNGIHLSPWSLKKALSLGRAAKLPIG